MANLKLSSHEIEVVQNADFLLTKNAILKKMHKSLGELAAIYQKITADVNPTFQKYCTLHPKISKGEQYEGLPYLMLDYPRNFSHTDIFAIRSFFWWGNYFSISLLLQGESMQSLADQLAKQTILKEWHLDISAHPWNHKWDLQSSPKLSTITNHSNITENNFFKISKQLPLSEWQQMEDFFEKNFRELWTAINYPNV